MKKVNIQIKDISGRWFTVQTCLENDQIIQAAMNSVQAMYKKDARAVTPQGAVVQFYPYISGGK